MLNKEELESALACAGHCCDCKMPLPDEEFACEHTLAETAIAKQQEIERLRAKLAALQAKYDKLNDFEHSQCVKLLAESRRRELVVSTIPCCECGGEVVEFTVPNDIWNFVMRPDGKETGKEYLCLDCWYKALRSKLKELEYREQAAVKDIPTSCGTCVHYRPSWPEHHQCALEGPCCWQWRGPQAQEQEANHD